MKKKKKLGLDKWEIEMDMYSFLSLCSHRNIMVYDVYEKQNKITFYTSFFQRYEIHRILKEAEYKTTTGILGFLLRSLRQPARVISIAISIGIWYVLSNMIFEIDIKGDKQVSSQLIETTLQEMNLTPPFYSQDLQQIKMNLKKALENDIAWLEMTKEGSRFKIHYTTKEFANIESLSRNELVAQKDGVIAKFDLQHGNKNCQLNDYVKAGDVLVRNILTDSMNVDEEIFVKGKVYAYTWEEVEVSMEANELPEAFQFFQLLFEARRQVSKELKSDEKIYKENILQFSNNMGKINMKVHYTLFEDITTP